MAKRVSGLLAGLLGISSVAFTAIAVAQVQHTPTPPLQNKFAEAAETTSRVGFHATLPPHISTLLGVAKEIECPILQSVIRAGQVVQGLDVSVANKRDIVLFLVNESTKEQTYYLTSPAGKLRRVVAVKKGVGDVAAITPKEEKSFQDQKQYWIGRLVPHLKAK